MFSALKLATFPLLQSALTLGWFRKVNASTLFQNSDNTTRWISLPQHLVKPLHTSRCKSCKLNKCVAAILLELNPVNGCPGIPTELVPPNKRSFTLWRYNKASLGELVSLEILGKHQQGLIRESTKFWGRKVHLVVSSEFFKSVLHYLYRYTYTIVIRGERNPTSHNLSVP